jgi:hypothetical protein
MLQYLPIQHLRDSLAGYVCPQQRWRGQDDGGSGDKEQEFEDDLSHGVDLTVRLLRHSASVPDATRAEWSKAVNTKLVQPVPSLSKR